MRKSVVALACAATMGSVQAKDLFELDVLVNGNQSASRGFNSVTDMVDTLSDNGLRALVDTYNDQSAAHAALFIRGLPAEAEYNAQSATLYFRVPSLGISQTFAGANRDESQEMFKAWLRGDGQAALTAMLKELARVSPVDPVAGNPGSLMGQMVASDFGNAMDSGFIEPGASSKPGNAGVVGLEYGQYSNGDYKQNVTRLPLGWNWGFANGYIFKLDLPITYTSTEGAKTGVFSVGGSLLIPIVRNWYLTPALRIGATGSEDLGAAAMMYSGSLTSRYSFEAGGLVWGMTNMVGVYRTQSLKAGDYEVDYDLANTTFRNGFDVGGKLPGNYGWRAWIIDTRFTGDELYSNNYQEYGVAGNMRVDVGGVVFDKATLGVTYINGQHDVHGFKLNFGYKF